VLGAEGLTLNPYINMYAYAYTYVYTVSRASTRRVNPRGVEL